MPLSRLTYCSYVIHPLIIWWFIGTQEVLTHYSIPAVMMLFLSKVSNINRLTIAMRQDYWLIVACLFAMFLNFLTLGCAYSSPDFIFSCLNT